ncbi:MAG: phenylacetic acid degradation operon negative regulatory protein PaaX [Hyphomicrobiales bacterium]|nr:MAG: phenylacetic acid degradation operon negative regulatory protein PaaX [Hyphomicrobiales bacterium]
MTTTEAASGAATAIDPAVARLVDHFQARTPIRAWSLIVTVYGDAIVPRGGVLWLGSLIDLLDVFGVAPGLVRTAVSRLTADDWLMRTRVGRKSYYRLSPRGRAAFAEATRRIYFARNEPWDGRFHLAILDDGGEGNRSAVRRSLEEAGFGAVAPTVMIAPSGRTRPEPGLDYILMEGTAVPGGDARRLAERAWPLERIAAGYERFIAQFEPLAEALEERDRLSPLDAVIARILLVHEFRRIILRDPELPAALLPENWPGSRARALSARLYKRLVNGSESWLDRHAFSEDGRLPPPEPAFFERFA